MPNQDEYLFAQIGGNNIIIKINALVSKLRMSVVLILPSFESLVCFFNTELKKFF